MSNERILDQMLARRFGCGRSMGIELNLKNTPPESIYGDGSVAFDLSYAKATRHFACAYEINFPPFAFGKNTLRTLIQDLNGIAPEIPVILKGCNCPDVAFGELGADAVTGISPYPGGEMLSHYFLENKKGVFVVLCYCLAGNFQEKRILLSDNEERRLLFEGIMEREEWPGVLLAHEYVAYCTARIWNRHKNCGLDVDASRSGVLGGVRFIIDICDVPDMPIIVRHIGTNEESIGRTIRAGRDKHGQGMILFPNQGIISMEDPRGDAERLHLLISSLNV